MGLVMKRSGLCALAVVAALAAEVTPAQATKYETFRSPSRAITCAINGPSGRIPAQALCYNEFTLSQRPSRSDCGSNASAANVAATGPGRLAETCNPLDYPGDEAPSLPYGKSITVGPIRCTSRTSGMTCISTRSRHGFTLNRRGVRFF
jgi:hypothetical protein